MRPYRRTPTGQHGQGDAWQAKDVGAGSRADGRLDRPTPWAWRGSSGLAVALRPPVESMSTLRIAPCGRPGSVGEEPRPTAFAVAPLLVVAALLIPAAALAIVAGVLGLS